MIYVTKDGFIHISSSEFKPDGPVVPIKFTTSRNLLTGEAIPAGTTIGVAQSSSESSGSVVVSLGSLAPPASAPPDPDSSADPLAIARRRWGHADIILGTDDTPCSA